MQNSLVNRCFRINKKKHNPHLFIIIFGFAYVDLKITMDTSFIIVISHKLKVHIVSDPTSPCETYATRNQEYIHQYSILQHVRMETSE